MKTLEDVLSIDADNDDLDHHESTALHTNELGVLSKGLTPSVSRASELNRRMQNVIKTLKLSLTDQSNVPAYFGFLEFKYPSNTDKNIDDVVENDRLSSFIHVAANTKALSIAKIVEAYQLRAPDFILSIQTGRMQESDSYKQKSGTQAETEHAIQHGLTETARITHPWITTSCTNQDVMKLLGNALDRDLCGSDIPCLGFCNWNFVSHEHGTMTSMFNQSIHPLNNEYPPIHQYIMTTSAESERDNAKNQLEPNHTHFFFFDGGSNDVENMLLKRQAIEHELSISKVLRSPVPGCLSKNIVSDNDIPIIMLLIGGDFETLNAICEGLTVGTPVIVIRNTGGIADIIAQLCRKSSPTDELAPFRKKTYAEECKNEFKKLFEKENITTEQHDDIEKYVDILREMEELVIVFDAIEPNAKLEDTIADAMLTGIKYEVDNWEQFFCPDTRAPILLWCTLWNKANYAHQLLIDHKDEAMVLTNQTEENKNQVIPLAQQLLFEALHRNNVPFMSLLMEYGASIEQLTDEQLIIICVKTMNDDALILYKSSLDSMQLKRDAILSELKTYVEQRYNGYLRQHLNHYVIKDNTRENKQMHRQLSKEYKSERKISASFTPFSKIFDERKTEALYLWFIFMNQPTTAKYLCSRCRNQIVASLLAVEIYETSAIFNTLNRQNLKAMSQEFDQHARGIIDKCLAKDEQFALKLLEIKATAFYRCSPLDVAQRANCRIFLASNTIQKHLKNIWYHHFDHQQRLLRIKISVWIFFSALVLPLVPIASVLFPALYKKKSDQTKLESKIWNPYRPVVIHAPPPVQETLSRHVNIYGIVTRIKWFYEAPVIRFYYNLIFFILFLALFSYVLLMDYLPVNIYGGHRSETLNLPISITELILHICMWSLIIDELYQFMSQMMSGYKYSSNAWNWMDQAGILLYLIAFLTRWSVQESFFICSKIFMSIDCVIWYIRILYLFAGSSILGPKLTMIYEMTKEAIVIFICFILVILFGFSVASWSLLTTKEQVIWSNSINGSFSNGTVMVQGGDGLWKWQILRDVFNWGIWKVFGQVAEPYNDAVSENDAYGTFVFLFSIGFTVISNILLLNVLIAMFNEKIQRVQEKSIEIWRYQRFWLIYEIKDKTVLPPPFNILCYLGEFIKYVCCCCCKSRCKSSQHNQNISKTMNNSKFDEKCSILDKYEQLSVVVVDEGIAVQSHLVNNNEKSTRQHLSIDIRQINREKVIAESYWQDIFHDEKQNKTIDKEDVDMDKIPPNHDYQQSLNASFQTQTKLELSNNQISDKGAQRLAEIIQRNATLTQLDLSKNCISNQGTRYLTDALLNNKTITTLNLSENNIGDQGAKYVADSCRNNKTLNSIDLSKNQIGDSGAQYLADVLLENTTLTILKLDDNHIGDYGAKRLANILRNNTILATLSIAVNQIEAQGVQQLAQALTNNATLTTLNLSSNKISDKGVQYLADVLRNNTTLTTLDLGFNRIGNQGAQHLANALRNDAPLTTLNLSSNEIGYDGIKHLVDAMNNIERITTLDIGSNGIGDEGIQYLAIALKSNKTLTTLNLSSNQIGIAAAKYLAETIGYTAKLTQVNLSHNQLGVGGVQELAPTLRLNTTLTTLSLSNNRIGREGARHLAYVLQTNTAITTLDLSRNQITDTGLMHLAAALLTNETLLTLDLSNNEIRNKGIEHLVEAFESNTTLATIILRFNKIDNAGARTLAYNLMEYMNVGVATLDLGYNRIGDQGAHDLADVLQLSSTVTRIEMTGNPITITAAKYLSQTLRHKLILTTSNFTTNDNGIEWADDISNSLKNNTTLTTLNLEEEEIGYKEIRLLSVALRYIKTPNIVNLNNNQIGIRGAQYLSEALRNKTTLTQLKLRGNEIRAEGVLHLVDTINSNTSLAELDLSDNDITDKGLQYLIDVLRNNKTLTTLNLAGNKIKEEGIQYLVDAFRDTRIPTVLDLGRNKIGNLGMKCLADGFQKNTTLTTLKLNENQIEAKGIQHLADFLRKMTTITTLDLTDNRVGIEGAEHLANFLCNNQTLKTIKLGRNRISGKGTQYLASALENNNTLTELNLSNNEIGAEGAEHLAETLRKNTTLTSLSLSKNKINANAIKHLADAIENNNTLTELYLSSNKIGDDGIVFLTNALKNNKTLITISLFAMGIGDPGAESLASALQNNNTLTTLTLYNNDIADEGARHLADIFRCNKTLTDIDLYGNEIGDRGAEYLAVAFQNNTTLTTLDLRENNFTKVGTDYLVNAIQKKDVLVPFHRESDETLDVKQNRQNDDDQTDNTKLLTFDLKDTEKGAERAQYLANIFANNKTLKTLNLKNDDIGSSGAQNLANAFQNCTTLTALNLANTAIGDEGIQQLTKIFENNITLTTLDLSQNKISADGIEHLAKTLENNNTLVTLNLSKNEIGIEGSQRLAKAFENNNKLVELNLSDNQIDNEGLHHLAKALKINNTLTTLDLAENKIDAEGMEQFSHFLQHNKTLVTLVLDHNKLDANAMKHLAIGLQNNNMLIKLDLGYNMLDDEAIFHLSDVLLNNKTLTNLVLSKNQFGNQGAEYLAVAFKNNKTLIKLNIMKNQIGDQGAKALATAFQNNTTLTYLNLDGNEIKAEGAQHLAATFKSNNTITYFDLAGNNIGDEGAHDVAIAFQNNQTLKTLDIRRNQVGKTFKYQIMKILRKEIQLKLFIWDDADDRD